MNNHLELIRIFSVAAESSNFREAAQRLGISPQGVTRAVKALEQHFGEVLFHRNTRRVKITDFGEQLAIRAKATLNGVEQLFSTDHHRPDVEAPLRVRITMPRSLGRLCVLPELWTTAMANPGIVLDIRLSDEITDVIDEQIDIGVRVGFMRDNRFVARQVSRMSFVVVATPGLAARFNHLLSPDDLPNIPVTGFLDKKTGRPWPWYLAEGKQFIPRQPVLITDDPETERDAVLAGLAFAQMPRFLVAPYLARGELVTVLDAHAPPAWGIYVYRPQRGPVAPRIRLVFDELVRILSTPQ